MINLQIKTIIYGLLCLQIMAKVKSQDFGNIAGNWKVRYGIEDEVPELQVGTKELVNLPLEIYDIERNPEANNDIYFEFVIEHKNLANVQESLLNLSDIEGSSWQGVVKVQGHYLGYTNMYITLNDPQNERMEKSVETLAVKVVRNKRVDDKTFIYIAAAIMLLMFINLGTVLDLKRVGSIFKRPIGPLLGFCSRYIVMPGLAIGLGVCVFADNTMQQILGQRILPQSFQREMVVYYQNNKTLKRFCKVSSNFADIAP